MQHNEIIRLYDHSPLMKRKLEQGISLVVDRYAFSGAAFTSAKPVSLLLAFQTLLTSYHITVCVCVCVRSNRHVMTCLSPSGFLSGLVQEPRCGAAEAGPCYVPTAQSSWGCSERSVWRREIWDQCFPKSGATEIWTTNEGSFSQLAGMRWVWIVDLIPGVIYVNIYNILWSKLCFLGHRCCSERWWRAQGHHKPQP